jgi:hypothetical protein
MSKSVSNLYAARIYAEHPIALWSLDDEASYISKLSTSQKDIANWSLYNLEQVVSPSAVYGEPMAGNPKYYMTINSASVSLSASALASPINTELNLDPDKKTISINTFFYDTFGFVLSIDIGFRYNNNLYFSTLSGPENEKWQKVSHTMEVPEGNIDIYPFVRVNYLNAGPDFGDEYNVVFNGLSVGQWSELFHYETTGKVPEQIQDATLLGIVSGSAYTSLSASAITTISADSYGIGNSNNGYYLVEKNRMLSSTLDFPITFGSNNITSLRQPLYGRTPSLVFEGQGFLNEFGRYRTLTAEFWLRTYTTAKTPIKIFGPLTSEDGIYIESDFIIIKIGLNKKSYFIGKWYRPMLIDFIYNIANASLLINGDLVIQMDIDQDSISFPEIAKDYVGFFCDEEIPNLEIDCFAVYPYAVPEQVAKRRFIYAQGVEAANNIATNFNGDSFQLDFPYAKYTSTLNYPDMNDWNSGFFNNLSSTSRFLSFPDYQLPDIIFSTSASGSFEGVELNTFLTDNYNIQNDEYPFIKLRPDSSYNNIVSSIYFSNLNFLNSPIRSIFGVFESPVSLSASPEVLMTFSNSFNSNTFEVTVSNSGLEYYFNSIKVGQFALAASSTFIAGIDLNTINTQYAGTVENFFFNPQNLSLRLGGTQNSVYSGKIHRITFNNALYTQKDLSEYITASGFFTQTLDSLYLKYYIGNYTFYPQRLSNSLLLDIGASGYWEDSIPLSYFGRYVEDRNKNSYYDLDLLQYNIETPSSPVLRKDQYYLDGGSSQSSNFKFWFDDGFYDKEVGDIDLEFDGGGPSASPIYLTDLQLDSAFKNYSKENYFIKSYVTLQNFADVGKIPYSQYEFIQRINGDRVLDFDSETIQDFNTTKYEVMDRTVIFPPKELVDFKDYYITVHIELQTNGLINNPIQIKKMSLSSLAYDESAFYSISSPDGYKLYPFSRYDKFYVYKNKNPFVVYKDSTSYMYTTADSGISVLPYTSSATRGITVPINQQQASEYLLGGVQFWGFYNKNYTIEPSQAIAQIKTYLKTYTLYLSPESNSLRGKVVVYDENNINVSNELIFYQNGKLVDDIYITPLTWNSILIVFDQGENLANYVGQFEVYEGLMVNNMAFYRKSNEAVGREFILNDWVDLSTETTWQTWENAQNWSSIEGQVEELRVNVDGSNIYESTFGVASVVLDDTSQLNVSSDNVTIITGTIWEEYSQKPV